MKYLKLLLVMYFSSSVTFLYAKNSTSLLWYSVGVILDMESPIGKMGNLCTSMAISDFYAKYNSSYKTRLVLHARDSKDDPLHALSSAINLLENEKVQAIIGPQTSEEAELLVRFGDKAKVPIISFSVTSPFFSQVKNPYFIRVATNDNSQVRAICAIIQAFRWREIVLIHEDTVYGNGIVPNIILGLEEINVHVPYHSLISPLATEDDVGLELYKLMTMSTRVFIVHMHASLASKFFLKVKEVGMMSIGYAWIITDGVTNNLHSLDSSVIDSMQGVIGIRPYTPNSEKLKDFTLKWGSKLHEVNQHDNVNVFCLWAYDAVWALATAAEKVSSLGSASFSHISSELVKAILQIKFEGLSGDIKLSKRQFQPVAFQIVNVIGKGVKEIGFWTSRNGLEKVLNLTDSKAYSTSLTALNSFISWPGNSLAIPKSWKMPVTGKRLRIGVPIRTGFPELVKMEIDPQTNTTTLTGFCIDVFQTAVEMLPYAVAYDLIPVRIADGDLRNYDDLIYQVYLQKFDAAVGDITITANRSSYVDFTVSFTQIGMGIIVPVGALKNKSMWIFFHPLTLDLWLVGAAFFIWTGFIVWLIEHGLNNNTDFKQKPIQQLATVFSYSFSTLVFAQWEILRSNFSKFVVMVWLFVVFILTSSYTASLSSLLTINELQSLPKGGYIGFPFAFPSKNVINNTLLGEATLKPLVSVEEYYNVLREGNRRKNGILGLADEIPYLKLVLAKYPHQYTMMEAIYQTSNGFGFAFPKRSSLAVDFSTAIMKLREEGKIQLMEEKWFQIHEPFKKQESDPPQASILNFRSFRGLFILTGTSSIFALTMLYLYMFIKKRSGNQERSQLGNQTVQEPTIY